MSSKRLPRFRRAPLIPPITVIERDRALVRLFYRHRFLRSSHIISLVGGSPQQILRRLQLLYHHGYVERPRIQIEFYHQGGSREIVYSLGTKGLALLEEDGIRPLPASTTAIPSRRPIYEHDLFVSDVMVALELSCRKTAGIHLLARDELPLPIAAERKLKWKVKVNNQVSLGVLPDRVFAISCDTSSNKSPCLYFLEADRGTMPIVRADLSQTSFFRKLLAYEATWKQGFHRSLFGYNRFRVLTVTTTASRMESLIAACAELKSGLGLFLFCDRAAFQNHPNVLTLPWTNGRGEPGNLMP